MAPPPNLHPLDSPLELDLSYPLYQASVPARMPRNHSDEMIERNPYRRLSFGSFSLGSSFDGAEETSLIFVGYPGETPPGLHGLGNLLSVVLYDVWRVL
ncbi:unnamed protein product [Arabis nemorensis]|uniref:Uncharacterized protein n=1 Tax=Arabis nemorensis TaxID=586526 RepID=A0A565AWF1_9BRAS|nr:unnamed protein product [Arabis nemorensis]